MECNESEIETTEKQHINKGPLLGMRHCQALLLFLNVAVLYLHRVHVAISLVAMTDADKSNPDFPEYNWNKKEKSYILSSFYWGYFLTQYPGAYCVRRFGVKINLFMYTLCTGLLSLLVPFCISWGGWQAFCLLRFLQGFFQGGVYPAFLQHLAKWSPPAERGLLSGFAHTGYECGSVSAMALSGFIAASSVGWPGIFYIFSVLCFIWCALWQLFGANDVTNAHFITREEQLYIKDSLKHCVNFEKRRLPVPWRAIFRSKVFYALLVTRSAAEAGIVTIQGEWPSYMNAILKLNIENSALFSALPSVASWISAYLFMFISDFITKRELLSLSTTRKCFNSISMWVPAIGIVLIGFLDEKQKNLAIGAMIIVCASYNSILMGSVLSPIDMAPNHTDMIVSIINITTTFATLFGPLFVGIVVDNEQIRGQWQIAFTTMAVIFIIGDLAFLVWGTAKEQPWNAANFLKAKKKTQATEKKGDEPGTENLL